MAPNGVDAPVAGTNRVFNFAYNPETDAPTTAAYRNGDVTNMFYWMNRYHDLTYLLGFNEQARNFQDNNFGRGGVSADRVSAEGQDFSGTDNANFATPPDGGRGRMQMYVWTGPNPDRSGDLDQDVIFHEATHGLSNRLHGNATGLNDNMSAGLGEGWSDFYARALLATEDEDVNGIYTIAGWATHLTAGSYTDNYYYGIRRFPYAPRAVTGGPLNRPHNPLTFRDADFTQFDITDGAFPPGPFGAPFVDAPHNLGEIWASMLWEVRARFIARQGFSGNQEFLQYVTDGMKLSPLSPNFLQARDAILAAATAGGATPAHIADIWAGFAARGLGVFAEILSESGGNNTRVVENFLSVAPTFSINDVTLVEGNAGTTTATFTVTLTNPSPAESRVSFSTADGTATGGTANDYMPASGLLTFPAGTTSQPVAVTINGDGTVEPSETFFVNLFAPFDAVIGDAQGQGTILNDDGGSLPTSANDAYSTAFNTPLTVAAPGILANDNSNGGGALTALLISNVSSGALTLAAGGSFTYTPNAGFSGIDSFTYRALNGNGAGTLATATITVQPPAPPTSLDDAYNTPFDTALTVPAPGVLGNDGSNGGGAMTATLVTNAVNGVLALNANGGFTYTPTPGFVGADSFTYLATNSVGAGNVATVLLTVAAPTTIQPPIGLYVSSMEGNLVTFRWRSFPFGPQPTGHVIEGGVNPGEVLGSLPTGSPYPIFTVSVPTGSFFIRMHALDGSDRSGASNEIQIFVNVPQQPSSPANLVGVANGDTVGLAWRNTFAGGAPSSLVLDVTGSQTGSLPLGMTDNFSFAGIPGGTYTFTVRETNDTGTSAQSNAVTMTFPSACSGAPLAPSNFLAYKIGTTVYLVWDPPVSGPATTSYIVNVTGSFVGGFPTAGRSLSGVAPPGTYTFTVTGVNDCGSATTSEQTVTIP